MKNKVTKVNVLAFGTFDVLHPGHLSYLRQAKRFGTHLTVIIARDVSVKKEKKHTPRFSEHERLTLVQAVRIVDRAVLGDLYDHLRLIKKISPDVICLGYDHAISIQELRKNLAVRIKKSITIRRMKAYRPLRYKSSLIKLGTNGAGKKIA